MRADYLILADAVSVAGGKHYIHGGGWDALVVASLPAIHPLLGVAVRLRIPWDETGQQFVLEIDVLGGKERESILNEPVRGVFNAEHPTSVPAGSDLLLHMALSITNLNLEKPGPYAVVLRSDGQTVDEAPFNVILLPGPPE